MFVLALSCILVVYGKQVIFWTYNPNPILTLANLESE